MTDLVRRLYFSAGSIRGHWVQLDSVMQELAARRTYAEPVARTLGELLAAVSLIADGLKWPGSVALQAKLDGDVRVLLSEYRPDPYATDQGLLRAIAPAGAARRSRHDRPCPHGRGSFSGHHGRWPVGAEPAARPHGSHP